MMQAPPCRLDRSAFRRALIRVAYACLVAIVFEAACAVFVIFVLPGFKPYYFVDFYDRYGGRGQR